MLWHLVIPISPAGGDSISIPLEEGKSPLGFTLMHVIHYSQEAKKEQTIRIPDIN